MFEKSSKKAFTSKRYDALAYCVKQEINVILGMLLHQEIPIFILKQNGSSKFYNLMKGMRMVGRKYQNYAMLLKIF